MSASGEKGERKFGGNGTFNASLIRFMGENLRRLTIIRKIITIQDENTSSEQFGFF